MRLISQKDRSMVRPPPATRGAHSRSCGTSRAAKHRELVVCVRQRRAHRFPPATRDRNSAGAYLCSLGWRSMEQPAGSESSDDAWLVYPRDAWMGLQLHGGDRPHSHGAGISLRRLQISPRTHLDHRRLSLVDDSRHGIHRSSHALRSGRVLGIGDRSVDRQPRSDSRPCGCEVDVRWADHCRRNTLPILRPARLRDSRNADRFRRPSRLDGVEAGNQRMADAGTHRKASDL